MITIENKEDIEILLEFFQLINGESESEKATDSEEILKRIGRIEKAIMTLGNKIQSSVDSDESTMSDIKTVRRYTEAQFNNLPQIKELTKDGKLIGGRNQELKYTIEDLLKLKPLIPRTDLSFVKLADIIGYSHPTIRIMACGIETGHFNHWFNQWEQIQADIFKERLDNLKPSLQNNPQKRKEMGL